MQPEEGWVLFRRSSLETWLEESISSRRRPSIALRLTNMLAFACVVAVHTVWWVLPIPNTTPEVTEAHMTPLNPCG